MLARTAAAGTVAGMPRLVRTRSARAVTRLLILAAAAASAAACTADGPPPTPAGYVRIDVGTATLDIPGTLAEQSAPGDAEAGARVWSGTVEDHPIQVNVVPASVVSDVATAAVAFATVTATFHSDEGMVVQDPVVLADEAHLTWQRLDFELTTVGQHGVLWLLDDPTVQDTAVVRVTLTSDADLPPDLVEAVQGSITLT